MSTPESVPSETPWLTKQQAADAIGVSTKTVEQIAKAGKLRQEQAKVNARYIVVYHPEDVALVAAQRKSAPLQARRLTPPQPTDAPASRTVALTRRPPMQPAGLQQRASAEAIIQALRSEKFASEKVFLTIPEAAALTGLTQAYIRRLCQKRRVKAIRDGGWKIRRKALLAL